MNNDYYRRAKELLDHGSIKASEETFRLGIQNGDIKCYYGLVAIAAITGSDMKQPIEKLSNVLPDIFESCADNDSDAYFILGRCYELGLGVPVNLCSALHYYSHAANMGNPDSMFNMGCIYMHADPPYIDMALSCYQKAADYGLVNAYRALWYYYQKTDNVQEAKKWGDLLQGHTSN